MSDYNRFDIDHKASGCFVTVDVHHLDNIGVDFEVTEVEIYDNDKLVDFFQSLSQEDETFVEAIYETVLKEAKSNG